MLRRNIAAVLGVMVFSLSSLIADTGMNVKVNGCKGPVLCSNFPMLSDCEDCCHTWHVDVGLLYQQPGFSGMNAGICYSTPFVHETGALFQNQVVTNLTQCFDYDPGLTVSLGHLFMHDDWFLLARFDWLSTSIGNRVYEDNQAEYKPNANFDTGVLPASFSSTDIFTKIKYGADMDIYTLDVLLSRGAFLSKCYSFEPFAGVKAAWFDANQNANYYNATEFPGGSYAIFKELRSNWGVGPMFGFNGEYNFTQGFALFSDSDIAVLYGEASRTITSILTNSSDVAAERKITNQTKYDCQYYVPVRTILGVKLSRYCLEDNHYLAVKIGYDARALVSYTNTENGYVMSGLYLNFLWDF
ncbi:MAG: hypothetical protein S4CHLAM20_05400 [Chlamydiia bacterium]|nr:hypothetical protein [Chlamydiia bacterium]